MSSLIRQSSLITYSQFGDRCFAAAAAGSTLWNSLPIQLRQADVSYMNSLSDCLRLFCSVREIAAHCDWRKIAPFELSLLTCLLK